MHMALRGNANTNLERGGEESGPWSISVCNAVQLMWGAKEVVYSRKEGGARVVIGLLL